MLGCPKAWRQLAWLASIAALSCQSQAEVVATGQIHPLFANYRQAVAEKDAATVAALIDDESLAMYESVRLAALSDDPEELGRRTVFQRFLVHSARSVLTRRELQDADNKGLIAALLQRGRLRVPSQLGIDSVKVDGDVARASLTLEGQVLPTKLRFTRKGQGWRIDLTSLAPVFERVLSAIAKQLDRSIDDYLLEAAGQPRRPAHSE